MTDDEIKAALIVLSHQQAHTADHDPQDTVMLQLTRRECWHVLYGMLCSSTLCPELADNSAALLEKMAEVLEVQKDNWVQGDGKETP